MNEKMRKGAVAMLKLQEQSLARGFVVSMPIVEGLRYDCLLDTGDRLLRVQVKYAGVEPKNSSGCVQVRLDKPYGRGVNRAFNGSEIDLLCVYMPKPDLLCVFGEDVFSGSKSLRIRFSKSKNGQVKNCLMAEEYRFDKWLL